MARAVRIHGHGGPDVLQFDDVEVSPPGRNEVTLDVKAIGLNRSEAMFRVGKHPETVQGPPEFPARLGFEAAGVVLAVGAEVLHLKVGDPVSLIPLPSVTRWGTYADVVNVPADFAVKHPSNLSWTDAAASWMQYITAYGGLVDIARLTSRQTALILAGGSSVGLASIDVVNRVGGISIATTRSAKKKQALLDHGAKHVIVTSEEDVVERVKEITNGVGADVVFDPIAGPGIENMVELLAHFGQLILYGALDPNPTPVPLFGIISKGVCIRGFSFKEVANDRERRNRARDFILEGLTAGELKPVIAKIFPFEEMIEAHRYLESNEQFGKIVVTV